MITFCIIFYSINQIMWYNINMKNNKSLAKTNPYLRNKKQYERLLLINVTTSTALEIGTVSLPILTALKDKDYPLLIHSEKSGVIAQQ